MFTIKGFSTKKDVVKQLLDAGIKSVRLPFDVSPDAKVSKNPFGGKIKFKTKTIGNEIKIVLNKAK
jgi:hypothetical protein